jgi:hypothetical protein
MPQVADEYFILCCNVDPHWFSMRIRIQGAKPMRIHADPDPGQTSHKKLNYDMKNYLCRQV